MDDRDTDPAQHSLIPLVQVPKFDSPIPPYLLKGASDETKHLMNGMAVQSQVIEWMSKVMMETHSQLRRVEGQSVVDHRCLAARLCEDEERIAALDKLVDHVPDLDKLSDRVTVLERLSDRITGIWSVLVVVAMVLSTLVGWAMQLYDHYHPGP